MKKLIGLIILVAQFSCQQPKPEGLTLKVQYLPQSTYNISTIRETETIINYSGQEIAMRKLKSMRVKNPTISKVRTKNDTELITGGKKNDRNFPVHLTYKKTMSLDGKNEIPEGTEVEGKIADNHLPDFNKVKSETLNFDQKAQLLQNIKNSFDQFDFPERLLKIGDQFATEKPVSISMENSVIETIVTTNYKLVSLKNGIAQFELSQTYQMTPKRLDNSFIGKGTGNGKLTYDIENFLITDYSIKTELTMNKKLDYFEFDLITKNEFSQTTEISKH